MSERDDSIPGPHRPDWIDFLRYLARDSYFTADDIVSVVDSPRDFRGEYAEYHVHGGINRDY